MADLALTSIDDGGLDLVMDGGDISLDESGLRSAVLLSLLCHARADEADVVDSLTDDPRGFWGSPILGVEVGSKLWQIAERAKLTPTLLTDINEVARDALQWLIDDGVCSAVDVTAAHAGNGRVVLTVDITRTQAGSGGVEVRETVLREYELPWNEEQDR